MKSLCPAQNYRSHPNEPADSPAMKTSWISQVKLSSKKAVPPSTAHLIHGSLSSACKPGEDQTKEHTQCHDNVGYVGDDQSSVNHRLQSTCSLFINENTLGEQENSIALMTKYPVCKVLLLYLSSKSLNTICVCPSVSKSEILKVHLWIRITWEVFIH